MKYLVNSAEETQDIAQKIAQTYQAGKVIGLIGSLGAGKTTFAQGFAQGLGVSEHLLSPTFVLMRQYTIPGNSQGRLFHLDLYRLDDASQIESIGLAEILAEPSNIVLIEWAEKLGKMMPKNSATVEIKILTENKREITVTE